MYMYMYIIHVCIAPDVLPAGNVLIIQGINLKLSHRDCSVPVVQAINSVLLTLLFILCIPEI